MDGRTAIDPKITSGDKGAKESAPIRSKTTYSMFIKHKQIIITL